MGEAVANYADYLGGAARNLLGRFVLPVTSLPEFKKVFQEADLSSGEAWHLSAILDSPERATPSELLAWNRELSGRAFVDSVEGKSASRQDTAWLADFAAAGFYTYVEFVPRELAPSLVDSLPRLGLRAKFRTGGVTPDAFPSPRILVDFLRAARQARVPFKLTAGLHHALRGEYPLTYEPGAACHEMYGFLDVALASLMVWLDMPDSAVLAVLSEGASHLLGSGNTLRLLDRNYDPAAVRQMRAEYFVGFGSCSFEEPVAELQRLGSQ
jgi:hypothetical protein